MATKKKTAKVTKKASTKHVSAGSTSNSFTKRHPSAILYLVLFIGCVIIFYLMNWYSDIRVEDGLKALGN